MENGQLVRVVRRLDGHDPHFGRVGGILRTKLKDNVVEYEVVFLVDGSEPPIALLNRIRLEKLEFNWDIDQDGQRRLFVSRFFHEHELKPLENSGEAFWTMFHQWQEEHRKDKRREANCACNLMRNHREEEAGKHAKHCHPINLLLSALDRPPNFRRATRLSLEDYIELCRLAGKDMNEVADILFHLLFENKTPHQIGDVMPVCTCESK